MIHYHADSIAVYIYITATLKMIVLAIAPIIAAGNRALQSKSSIDQVPDEVLIGLAVFLGIIFIIILKFKSYKSFLIGVYDYKRLIICDHCASTHVEISRSRGWRDRIFRFLGFKPYRCMTCKNRFYRFFYIYYPRT